MNIIELIYRLIQDFARLNPVEVAGLKNEAMADYTTWKDETSAPLKRKIFKLSEHYLARTLFALLFIVISRWLRKTNAETDEYEQDHE